MFSIDGVVVWTGASLLVFKIALEPIFVCWFWLTVFLLSFEKIYTVFFLFIYFSFSVCQKNTRSRDCIGGCQWFQNYDMHQTRCEYRWKMMKNTQRNYWMALLNRLYNFGRVLLLKFGAIFVWEVKFMKCVSVSFLFLFTAYTDLLLVTWWMQKTRKCIVFWMKR